MSDAYLKVKDNGASGLALIREETDTSVTYLKNALNQQTIFTDTVIENGTVNYSPVYTNNAMNQNTGEQGIASNIRASTPLLYYIPINSHILITAKDSNYYGDIYCFAESGAFLGRTGSQAVSLNNIPTLPNGTRYVRFFVARNDNENLSPSDASSAITFTCVYNGIVAELDSETEKNTSTLNSILTNNNLLKGCTPIDGYYDTQHRTNSGYQYYEKIPVENGKTYILSPAGRMVYIYNASGTLINYVSQQNMTSITAGGDGFAYVTYYTSNSNADNRKFYEQNAENVYGPNDYSLSDHVIIPNSLNGKKWAVLGDSFTAGADSGTIQSGTYAGQKIVYPYLIGNRTGIEVLSFFAGGRTLAYPATPGDFVNSVTCPGQSYYYQNIPADTDYITIYLGINDSHHAPSSSGGDGEDNTGEIPIGTISDSTTATYYGAWNVVLTWIKTNRPFAHVGIIVSNGCEIADYRAAQIAIAKKYGIAYIDMNGDERTPAMIRPQNNDIASAVKTILLQTQAVDYAGGNYHPNNEAHELESYFIENFLRSI